MKHQFTAPNSLCVGSLALFLVACGGSGNATNAASDQTQAPATNVAPTTPANTLKNYFGKELAAGFAGTYSSQCVKDFKPNSVTYPKTLMIDNDGRVTADGELMFENGKFGKMEFTTLENNLRFAPPNDQVKKVKYVHILRHPTLDMTAMIASENDLFFCPINIKSAKAYYATGLGELLKKRLPKPVALSCVNTSNFTQSEQTLNVLADGSVSIGDVQYGAANYTAKNAVITVVAQPNPQTQQWNYSYMATTQNGDVMTLVFGHDETLTHTSVKSGANLHQCKPK